MVQEKNGVYSKAFVELNEIINNMNENLKNKIPDKTIKAIKLAGNKNYKFNYDKSKSLNEQTLLPETKSLLSVIYSDYLCSPEERKKWQEYDRFEMQKQDELKAKKYNSNVFENVKNTKKIIDISSEKDLQVVNDKKISLWVKIKQFIRRLFKK